MKVFVVNFSSFFIRDVAVQLQEQGAEILYWTGYKEDFKKIKKDSRFSKVIFHNSFDVLRGLPAQGIDTSSFKPVSEKVFNDLVQEELKILLMMERNDLHKMSQNEKRRLYHTYINYWYNVLSNFRPDAVIFNNIPHVAYTYPIYAVARYLGVRVINFLPSKISSRVIISDDYQHYKKLKNKYDEFRDKNFKLEDLSLDLQLYYKKQIAKDATPFYVKKKYIKKRVKNTRLLPTFESIFKNIKNLTFFKTTSAYLKIMFTKKTRILSLDTDGYYAGWKIKKMHHIYMQQKKQAREEYLQLQQQPDFDKKFIYVTLHNQPERNTNPMGGVYDDQILMVETIAAAIPDDWLAYVKETPLQWKWPLGHLGRYPGYYQKMAAIDKVRLIPTDISTYDLMDKAQTVATITGTVAWEAVMRGKPALVFGDVFYMYCDGMFRVRGSKEARQAIDQIIDGYRPSKQGIINFLAAIDKVDVQCYMDKRFKIEGIDISYEQSVKNLSDGLYKELIK